MGACGPYLSRTHTVGMPAHILSSPFRLDRAAMAAEYWPAFTYGMAWYARVWNASSLSLRLAGTVSFSQAVRSSSSSLSQGQPGMLLPQAGARYALVIGEFTSNSPATVT